MQSLICKFLFSRCNFLRGKGYFRQFNQYKEKNIMAQVFFFMQPLYLVYSAFILYLCIGIRQQQSQHMHCFLFWELSRSGLVILADSPEGTVMVSWFVNMGSKSDFEISPQLN